MWKKILLSALLLTSSLLAQETRFPTNTRYIGGGYVNKQPYFNTLEAALNNVKTIATTDNPFLFWIASHKKYISDWSIMYDSITTHYSGKISFGGEIDTSGLGRGILDSLNANLYRYDFAFQGGTQQEITLAGKTGRFIMLNVTVAQGGNDLKYLYKGRDNQRVMIISDYNNQDELTILNSGNIILPFGITSVTLGSGEVMELFYNEELGKFTTIKPVGVSNAIEEAITAERIITDQTIAEIPLSQVIDGWYEDDIHEQTSYVPLSRGVGRYDNTFELTQNTSVVKLGVWVSKTPTIYPVNVLIYKNGYNTGYKATVSQGETKIIETFDKDAVTFSNDDNVSLYYQYEGSDVISVKAFMEILLRENDNDFPEQNVTLAAMAIDSGTVQTFSLLNGEVVDSAVITYTMGDIAMVVARSNPGYKFIGWTGTALLDETRRLDDTAFISMTSAKTVRARFRKIIPTYKVIISDPIPDGDSTHAKDVRTAFLLGANETDNGADMTEADILIYQENSLSTANSFKIADRYGADVIVRSAGSPTTSQDVAQKYYPTLVFMPSGSNSYIGAYDMNNFSSPIVVTGCGAGADESDTNKTGYDIEWSAYHSTGLSSYSNGYIAGSWYSSMIFPGHIAGLAGYNDWYGFRSVIRENTWTKKNGYGNWAYYSYDFTDVTKYIALTSLNGKYYFSTIDPYMKK